MLISGVYSRPATSRLAKQCKYDRTKRSWSVTILSIILVTSMHISLPALAQVFDAAVAYPIVQSAGRVDWSGTNKLIAYDKKGADGYYDVYVMHPDGGNERCITCGNPWVIPQRHNGNPAWHPSGEFLVFQAEKRSHPGFSFEAQPGFGRHSDLWLASEDGQVFYQLTDGPASLAHGVLHPQFSQDGTLLTWSEMYELPNPFVDKKFFGFWKLKVADFSMGPNGPQLSNIREYQPGGPAFYENHGLSKDNRKILFTSNLHTNVRQLFDNDIYAADLHGGEPVRLASERYNEHAHHSPNGKKIVWMTNAGNWSGGTDLWMMNTDGSNKIRLTDFNNPGNRAYPGQRLVVADSAWNADGTCIVAYVQTDLFNQNGMIVMIELAPSIARAAGE